jgi:fluoride exporter
VERLLLVCLGGAFGSGARYLLSGWLAERLGHAFPYGTFAVNFAGSFLLAVLMQVGLASAALSPTARIALGTGVLGGFTTYSTFSYETFVYLREGTTALAALNVSLTLFGCLAACWLGFAAGRWWLGS